MQVGRHSITKSASQLKKKGTLNRDSWLVLTAKCGVEGTRSLDHCFNNSPVFTTSRSCLVKGQPIITIIQFKVQASEVPSLLKKNSLNAVNKGSSLQKLAPKLVYLLREGAKNTPRGVPLF